MNKLTRLLVAAGIALLGVTGTATAAAAAPPYVSRDDAALQQEAADPEYYGPGQSATVKVVCLKADWPWRKIQYHCYKIPRR